MPARVTLQGIVAVVRPVNDGAVVRACRFRKIVVARVTVVIVTMRP